MTNINPAVRPHHQDVQTNLQSPSGELLQALWVCADVLQKLLYGVCVLLPTHIDMHGQILIIIMKTTHCVYNTLNI